MADRVLVAMVEVVVQTVVVVWTWCGLGRYDVGCEG